MTENSAKALYESNKMLELSGGVLRPGGVELTRKALKICDFNRGERVLDLGCGPGRTSRLMFEEFGLRPLALDFSKSMLSKTEKNIAGLQKVQATGTALPLRDASLKGVISECVLSLTGDIPAAMKEISRVLALGGKVIISDIYSRNAFAPKPQLGISCCFNGAKSLPEIEAAAIAAGLKIKYLEDHTALLKQLAGQIIFSMGSLEKFWALFMDNGKAAGTCNAVNAMLPGYYLLIAEKDPKNE